MVKKFIANIPEGTHLAPSKDTFGTNRGTLLSDYTNQIVGQAEFEEADDYEDDCDNYEDDSGSSLGYALGGLLAAGVFGLVAGGATAVLAGGLSDEMDTDTESEYEKKVLSENERARLEKIKVKNESKLEHYKEKERVKLENYKEKERVKLEKKKARNELNIKEYSESERVQEIAHRNAYQQIILSKKEQVELDRIRAVNEAKIKAYNEKERVKLEKAKLKNDLKIQEYTEKEIRKSERRKQKAIETEELREKRISAVKYFIKSLFIKLFHGIRFILKLMVTNSVIIAKKIIFGFGQCSRTLLAEIKKLFMSLLLKIKNVAKEPITERKIDFELSVDSTVTPNEFSKMIDDTFNEFKQNMYSQEAQEHFIKILLLSNELAKEIRLFSNTAVNNNCSEWQTVMEKLVTEKTARYINYILESSSDKIEQHIIESITANFSGGIYNGDDYIPISLEQLHEALKILEE